MNQSLRNIEWSGAVGEPMYFRFSNALVASTESHAAGEVNVDVDDHGNVVGVELLSGDAKDFSVFLEIAKTRGLDLTRVHLAPKLVAPI